MSEGVETAKVKLVSIIAPDRLGDSIVAELRALGATGFTSARAEGWGKHGTSSFGLLQAGNIRIETLVAARLGRVLLERIAARFSGTALVAFMQDVEAIPHNHFD